MAKLPWRCLQGYVWREALLAIKCVRHAGDSNDSCDGQRGRQLAFAIVEFLPGDESSRSQLLSSEKCPRGHIACA